MSSNDFPDWMDEQFSDEAKDAAWVKIHPINKRRLVLLYVGILLVCLACWAAALVLIVNIVQWAW